jgi:hypothetical protein
VHKTRSVRSTACRVWVYATHLGEGDGAGDVLGALDGGSRDFRVYATHLGEGDGAGDALGALDGGALPQLPLLQGLLVDGVQQRGRRHPAVLAQQRLRARGSDSFRVCSSDSEAFSAVLAQQRLQVAPGRLVDAPQQPGALLPAGHVGNEASGWLSA